MKIIKTTHYRNHEESETSDYTLFESDNQQEVTKKFKRTCELLIHFEGLQQLLFSQKMTNYVMQYVIKLPKLVRWTDTTITSQLEVCMPIILCIKHWIKVIQEFK